MVEISEESSTTHDGAASSSTRAPTPPPAMSISQFVNSRPMDCTLFATRVLSLLFAASFLLPSADASVYYKALAAYAATTALRLQQRDSCHYLMYCVLFLMCAPMTMVLLPTSLYAALHASNFLVSFLNATGRGDSAVCRRVAALTSSQTANCLGIIACAEIFLVPLLISFVFVGKGSFFLPFLYYRFLTLRYASRRNPYTRCDVPWRKSPVLLNVRVSSAPSSSVARTSFHHSPLPSDLYFYLGPLQQPWSACLSSPYCMAIYPYSFERTTVCYSEAPYLSHNVRHKQFVVSGNKYLSTKENRQHRIRAFLQEKQRKKRARTRVA